MPIPPDVWRRMADWNPQQGTFYQRMWDSRFVTRHVCCQRCANHETCRDVFEFYFARNPSELRSLMTPDTILQLVKHLPALLEDSLRPSSRRPNPNVPETFQSNAQAAISPPQASSCPIPFSIRSGSTDALLHQDRNSILSKEFPHSPSSYRADIDTLLSFACPAELEVPFVFPDWLSGGVIEKGWSYDTYYSVMQELQKKTTSWLCMLGSRAFGFTSPQGHPLFIMANHEMQALQQHRIPNHLRELTIPLPAHFVFPAGVGFRWSCNSRRGAREVRTISLQYHQYKRSVKIVGDTELVFACFSWPNVRHVSANEWRKSLCDALGIPFITTGYRAVPYGTDRNDFYTARLFHFSPAWKVEILL